MPPRITSPTDAAPGDRASAARIADGRIADGRIADGRIACPECRLVHRRRRPAAGTKAVCVRCAAVLERALLVRPIDSALVCMARTLYYEARGQGRRGLEAVAHVVLNRVAHRQFPRTICGVVTEGGKRGPCQFSWYCDGRSDRPRDMREYARVFAIAWEVLAGLTKDPTGGANMFHNTRVRPRWARVAEARGRIGAHLFYYLRRR